jgi:hypothetical protein
MRPESAAEIAEEAELNHRAHRDHREDTRRRILRMGSVAPATLLVLGGALTIGALWLPWRHYIAYDGTSFIDPRDLAPYVPITEGWGHSFLVFTVSALVTGVLAWLLVMWRRGQPARAFALGAILFAGMGIVFAAFGGDGAQVGWSSEAADAGFYVCLVGYAALIAAGATLMATSGQAGKRHP